VRVPEGNDKVEMKRWRDVWQVPALLGALVVLLAGVAAALLTAPKQNPAQGIAHARRLVEAGQYAEALEHLNKHVLPRLSGQGYSPDDRRAFHLLRARALYLGQQALGVDRVENHANIRREYEAAERLGAVLEPDDNYAMARTLLALGDLSQATIRGEMLPDADRIRRVEVLKAVVERSMSGGPTARLRALDVLTVLATDPELSLTDRAWVLVRQGELMVASGYAEDAISKMLRALPRLGDIDDVTEGEIRLTLARAYLATGASEEARAQLAVAESLLGREHPLIPLVTLLRAEIDHQNGELQAARERYAAVLERTNFEEGRPAALLGLAEIDSQTGATGEDGSDPALDRYAELVDLIRANKGSERTPRERVGKSLMTRFAERFERREYALALRYAALAERLFGTDRAPAEVILAVAESSRRLADELLSLAREGGAMSLAQADPATQREARAHLMRAGDYFRMHAARVVRDDSVAYADSLWNAADAYDRAGDLDASIQTFQQFTSDLPGDSRRPEAMYRLGQAYRARGDLDLAARTFQSLLDARGGERGSGPWGDRSAVALALTLLQDNEAANDSRGEAILQQALEGEYGGPATPIFRQAALELGRHLLQTGRHEGAVERLTQYVALAERDGPVDGGDITIAKHHLAEAHRLLAASIARTLQGGLPEGTKRSLEEARREHLRRAGALYDEVRRLLEKRERRGVLEETVLRNAYFHRADCAFDLGEFDDAIRAYEAARERYAREPVALVAMTQIVAALVSQGKLREAHDANERARRFYASLPDSVWEDPALPMDRAAWERWLASQDRLAGVGEGGK
jgi:tetratricopeptide (TPR) repeat protein